MYCGSTLFPPRAACYNLQGVFTVFSFQQLYLIINSIRVIPSAGAIGFFAD